MKRPGEPGVTRLSLHAKMAARGCNMAWFDGFEARYHEVNGMRLFARSGGRPAGPPLLLLHGFPQTHAIWHRIARALQEQFFLVMPDLRGYGDSAQPPDAPEHANHSKRAMAADMVALMRP